MTKPTPKSKEFDVFLCHNSEDKTEIRKIAEELTRRDIQPWLDEWEIPPGTSWQTALEDQLQTIKAAAVFVGKSGFSPWHNAEMRALINKFVEGTCPVIPVILPTATETPKLPIFLKSLNWVDFRKTEPNPVEQLIWGITGRKPNHHQSTDSTTRDTSPEECLLPSKGKQVIEVRLPGNLDEFSSDQQMAFVQSLTALLKIGEVKVTRIVAGSIRLYLELNQEDADRLYSASKEGQLKELSISEARLYPAIAEPPDQEERSQLQILLNRVQEYWVDGVLKNSLYHEVLISLGKHAIDEAVDPPWKHIVALPTDRRHLLLQDRSISTVFDASGLLLILGEPGSGKTTSLLELAASLINRRKNDIKERVPIVLNLSSWQKNQALEEWIAAEMSAKYQIPVTIARTWLKKDYLVPLLDGLDEIQAAIRPDCVSAINEFIGRFAPSGLVVCCRLMEYQWLPDCLTLNGAICLEPLSSQDVNKFLSTAGPQLAGLQQALNNDSTLQELAQTPLMLSIMSLACEGTDDQALTLGKSNSREASRDNIFELYVTKMFQRKRLSASPFSQEQVMGNLSWLARKMLEQSLSLFMVEDLRPHWLGSRGQQLAYESVTSLSVGLLILLESFLLFVVLGWLDAESRNGQLSILIFGLGLAVITLPTILLGCRSISPFKNALMSMLISTLIMVLPQILTNNANFGESIANGSMAGLLFGLIGGLGIRSLKEIHLVETMRWQLKGFMDGMISGSIIGMGIGLIIGLGIVTTSDPLPILGIVLILGMIGGSLAGLISGLNDTVTNDKIFPNQGILSSLKNGSIALLLSWLCNGLVLSLIYWLGNYENPYHLVQFAFVFGLCVGLNRGGAAVVKHYAIRLVLWLTGATPFGFIPFLEHCTKLILLKKIGGGYTFIHRTLLEYFAALPTKSK